MRKLSKSCLCQILPLLKTWGYNSISSKLLLNMMMRLLYEWINFQIRKRRDQTSHSYLASPVYRVKVKLFSQPQSTAAAQQTPSFSHKQHTPAWRATHSNNKAQHWAAQSKWSQNWWDRNHSRQVAKGTWSSTLRTSWWVPGRCSQTKTATVRSKWSNDTPILMTGRQTSLGKLGVDKQRQQS